MNVDTGPGLTPDNATFADLRRRAGLTLAQLAGRCGYTQATSVWRVEKGHQPRLDRARRFAEALGVTLEQLETAISRAAEAEAERRDRPEDEAPGPE